MSKAHMPFSQSGQNDQALMTEAGAVVPPNAPLTNLNLSRLLAIVKLLLESVGILHLENPHQRWRLLIWGGTIALVEEEQELSRTLLRKMRTQKLELPDPNQLRETMTGMALYEVISRIYQERQEVLRPLLKEILFENLLAIYLSSNFTCVWHPLTTAPQMNLPVWKFAILDEVARRAVQQWSEFKYVRHPSQTVQLIDQQSSLAFLPLFAKVTNGKYRINEIADEFKQHISRTVQKFDKLAENGTVAILNLSPRLSKKDQDTIPDDLASIAIPEVLVVDDSPIQLKQMGELLKAWGYRTQLISDPRTVTQVMHDHKPGIAFVDINMGSLSGFDLIKEIRKDPNLKDLELVLITAADNVSNKFRASWAKCRFLAKPRSGENEHIQEFRWQLRQILREVVPLPSDILA